MLDKLRPHRAEKAASTEDILLNLAPFTNPDRELPRIVDQTLDATADALLQLANPKFLENPLALVKKLEPESVTYNIERQFNKLTFDVPPSYVEGSFPALHIYSAPLNREMVLECEVDEKGNFFDPSIKVELTTPGNMAGHFFCGIAVSVKKTSSGELLSLARTKIGITGQVVAETVAFEKVAKGDNWHQVESD